MKFLSNFLRVVAVLLAVCTLALFFFPFVNVETWNSNLVTADLNGLEVAFGGNLTEELGVAGVAAYDLITFKSGYFLGAFILTVVTALSMVLGLVSKKKGWDGTALVTGALAAILMVVFWVNPVSSYVDMGRVLNATISYTLFATIAFIGSLATLVMGLIAILVKDAVECKQTGALVIPKRIIKFVREYKSELKKVVWPGPRSVVKNTLVVLGFCAVGLIIIWLADWGLGELFNLCFGSNG